MSSGIETITIEACDESGNCKTMIVKVQLGNCDGDGLGKNDISPTTDTKTQGIGKVVHHDFEETTQVLITQLMPVPVKDYLRINFEVPTIQQVQLAVYDLTGRLLTQSTFEAAKGSNESSLNVADLPNGMYLLSLQTADQTVSERFVKQ